MHPMTRRFMLILDGVTITNADGTAIGVTSADEVTVFLGRGDDQLPGRRERGYTVAGDSTPVAVLSVGVRPSRSAGSGKLTVTGNMNDAINSSDGLVIRVEHDHRDGRRRRRPGQGPRLSARRHPHRVGKRRQGRSPTMSRTPTAAGSESTAAR